MWQKKRKNQGRELRCGRETERERTKNARWGREIEDQMLKSKTETE